MRESTLIFLLLLTAAVAMQGWLAVRQLRHEVGPQNSVAIHLTLVPYIAAAGELKTKPTQHSVQKLREIGISPDILLCRCDRPLPHAMKEKISLFSNVAVDRVIAAVDVPCIYELPLALHAEGIDEKITERLNIWARQPDLSAWQRTVERFKKPTRGSVKIGVVGKYVHLRDSYKSLHESLVHGGMHNDVRVELEYIDSEQIEERGPDALLSGLDAILVPGGFGDRGTEGKITAIRYARENKVPFFGICLGMQVSVIEYARNVIGLKGAHSTEMEPGTPHPVICLMEEQKDLKDLGGTMRLGAWPCALKDGSLAQRVYGKKEISERHRHRYEFNNAYLEQYRDAGMLPVGTNPQTKLVEVVELKDHPWFIGVQYHPELKSTVVNPQPVFVHFIKAAKTYLEKKESAKNPLLQSEMI